jgi:hypothetical protein
MGVFEEIKSKKRLANSRRAGRSFFMGWKKEAGLQAVPIF